MLLKLYALHMRVELFVDNRRSVKKGRPFCLIERLIRDRRVGETEMGAGLVTGVAQDAMKGKGKAPALELTHQANERASITQVPDKTVAIPSTRPTEDTPQDPPGGPTSDQDAGAEKDVEG